MGEPIQWIAHKVLISPLPVRLTVKVGVIVWVDIGVSRAPSHRRPPCPAPMSHTSLLTHVIHPPPTATPLPHLPLPLGLSLPHLPLPSPFPAPN